MRKLFYLAAILLVVAGCDTHNDTQPELIDERQEMLKVMEFTAKAVSEITVSGDVRNEILGYAKEEFGGEVTAHFTKLLDVQNPNSSSSGLAGSFARFFQNKAIQFDQEQNQNRSQSAGDIQNSLEDYLKEHNMALFGPYLAENHANSSKPITVSFDPLDDDKISNVGYRFIPKTSQGSVANHGGLNAPFNIDNYYMEEIQNVDDQYAYDNPTIFVIPDDGNTNIGSTANNTNNTENTERDIDCEDLNDNDIIELYLRDFQLNGNLLNAPWNRNFLEMWMVSGDDISFDSNNTAVVNENTALIFREFFISKSDGRDQTWLDVEFLLDQNWKRQEVNSYMILAYKTGSGDGATVTANVKSIVNSDGTSESTNTIEASIKLVKKFEPFHQFPYDRCGTLATFRTDTGLGLHQGLGVRNAGGRARFTLDVVKR